MFLSFPALKHETLVKTACQKLDKYLFILFFLTCLEFLSLCHNILKVCRIRDTNTEPSLRLALVSQRSAVILIKFYDVLLKGVVYSEAEFILNFFFFSNNTVVRIFSLFCLVLSEKR